MRVVGLGLACLALTTACLSTEHSSGGGNPDCHSQYERVADAATFAALKEKLAHDTVPQGRSAKVVDHHDGKTTVNILNRRHRTVMSLDTWQTADGRWTARQWSQCID